MDAPLISPFATPGELPNFLYDWLSDACAREGLAQVLRSTSRTYHAFIRCTLTKVRLRLDKACATGDDLAAALACCQRCSELFPNATEVIVAGSPSDATQEWQDAALDCLARLPQLQSLELPKWTLLSAQGLHSLQACTQLKHLKLCLTQTSLGEAVQALAPIKGLSHLDICAPLAGEGSLSQLTSLTSLTLGCPKPAPASGLAEGDWDDDYGGCLLPVSWLLRPGSGAGGQGEVVTDRALLAVARLPRLETLEVELGRASHVGIESLTQLASLRQLTCHLAAPSAMTSAAIRSAAERMPRLSEVAIKCESSGPAAALPPWHSLQQQFGLLA